MILKRNHASPGDCVLADHYLSPIAGRLYTSYGPKQHGYTCGTLFVDHASGKIFNFLQLLMTAVATIQSKHGLECIASDEGIRIKHYHSDNGIFATAAFKDDCTSSSQKITFSGVGAHHQNGIAERNIKTVSQWARVNMLHAAFHWSTHANIKLWPQAIDYAVWVFNRLPASTQDSAQTNSGPQQDVLATISGVLIHLDAQYLFLTQRFKTAIKYQNGMRVPIRECLLASHRTTHRLFCSFSTLQQERSLRNIM
jgi:hypothetical protein